MTPEPPERIRAADRTAVLRTIDAAANRAAEGLRVAEDCVRFALDDRHLMEMAKQLRHELAATLAEIDAGERFAARDSAADVGREVSTSSESRRNDLEDVVAANLHRTQEALRSLEEYGKLLDGEFPSRCESIRYRCYALERAIGITRSSLQRLADVRVYVLLDGGPSGEEFSRRAVALVAAGVDALQLRDKTLSDRELVDRGHRLREATKKGDILLSSPEKVECPLFLVNDRPDVAAICRADGVHVGQEELSVKDVRAIVGPRMLVGVSTHSIEQARRAVLDGASYIGVGPTFPSTTKSFEAFSGLDLVRRVAGEIALPAFAIGGIAPDNIRQVVAAGLRRAAIGAAITAAADPASAVRAFRERLAD